MVKYVIGKMQIIVCPLGNDLQPFCLQFQFQENVPQVPGKMLGLCRP
jgi:hypothetical protein